MATASTQVPKKPYVHDKTPFIQKHVLGATVQITYTDLNSNFSPGVKSAIVVGDYVVDTSGKTVYSGKCTKISKKYKNKTGVFVTIAKALKNGRNKISNEKACIKAHAINQFVRNKQSKQWYCVKAQKKNHVECARVFELPGLNYDDAVEVAADKTAADKATAEKEAAEKEAADKTAADKATAEKTAADKATAEKVAADKTAADKATAEKEAADKTAADKTAADKTAANKDAAHNAEIDREASARSPTPPHSPSKKKIVSPNSKL